MAPLREWLTPPRTLLLLLFLLTLVSVSTLALFGWRLFEQQRMVEAQRSEERLEHWERGCALSERARSLNPHHPAWYWFTPLFDAYRKGDYRGALAIASKINMPGFWRTQVALAASYGQAGEVQQAGKALRALLVIRPDFAVVAREELEKWWQPQLVEHLIDGLRKAGLASP